MFLERKFSRVDPESGRARPALCPVLPAADWRCLPALAHEVMVNVQLLLKARRGYDHVFPDYGLTPPEGSTGAEAQVERIQRELPETLARYEPRFRLAELDFEVDDEGRCLLLVTGSIAALSGTFRFTFSAASRRINGLEYLPGELP